MYADMVIYGGSYFAGKNLTKDYRYAAIKGEKIVSMGKGEEWKEYMGPDTLQIELPPNALVVPGFHDSHLHLVMSALNYNFVNLIDAESEEDAAKMVYEFSKTIPEDKWVVGLNWYHMGWKERTLPTKKSLDKYLPDRPVFLTNTEVHGAWVNSKALEVLGITEETPDPPKGEIVRDEHGEATGYLNEMAMGLAGVHALKFSIDREKELICKAADTFAQKGVTAVQDMRPELGYDLGQYDAFYALSQEGRLNIRVHSAANLMDEPDEVLRLQKQYNNAVFRICLMKQYMDGVPTTHTAMTVEPYKDAPDSCGSPINDLDKMQSCIDAAHQRGMSVRVHCCGDGAVKTTLDMYEHAIKRYGSTAGRHAIEHVEIIQPEDVERMAKLGIIASMQPDHMVSQVDNFADYPYPDQYSDKQMKTAWIFRTLLDSGVTIALGSDCPVVDADPIVGIYRAVTRKFNDGNPPEGYHPAQKITVEEALDGYTRAAAFAVSREHELGTLEAGKYADIAILDTNVLTCDPEKIKDTKVLYTIMNGKITYQR